ncbi:MAG: hydrogenase 3 maturation endopeptidase HyCI [Betaproteobacteria bacterium]|nr:MAG: hydrogenase 3 maturation endopeptidase HyCI [Betaproteobacteria bacterium]
MTATTVDRTKALVSHRLKGLLSGRVCVLGVGNRHRCDDGAGSLIAERLGGRTGALAIDAGAVPENYLEKVARSSPDTVLILETVDFGGAAGEIRILDPGSIALSGLSTHALSLQMTADYLTARTRARLAVLAIQPANVGYGRKLSAEVTSAVGLLHEILSDALREHASDQHDKDGSVIRGETG